ncbi:MAG TPA: MBL fold metallo-hydrolase, partial [Gemmatimonadaceae bacterium]|nr:MBL fold metallo-hydrolase [Gemmatimonadaceae bacterium]
SFALRDIYFTHMHADHVIGVIGLLRTMALQGRTEPMRLLGPKGAGRHLKRAKEFGVDRITFPVEIVELDPMTRVDYGEFAMIPFPVDHGPSLSMGYALVEPERKGRFNPELARELEVPEGPLWGQIHRGQAITLPDGRMIEPGQLVGPPRTGRTVVITGDTRPCDATVEMARGADLLLHEATFADEEAPRARETGHSTAREAAEVAARAGVRQLVLTHLSARYSRDTSDLTREAKDVFDNVVVGRDGMEVDVPYRDAGQGSATSDV